MIETYESHWAVDRWKPDCSLCTCCRIRSSPRENRNRDESLEHWFSSLRQWFYLFSNNSAMQLQDRCESPRLPRRTKASMEIESNRLTIRTCNASRSASENTATDCKPSRCAVRITRQAISPRLAIRILLNVMLISWDSRSGIGRKGKRVMSSGNQFEREELFSIHKQKKKAEDKSLFKKTKATATRTDICGNTWLHSQTRREGQKKLKHKRRRTAREREKTERFQSFITSTSW